MILNVFFKQNPLNNGTGGNILLLELTRRAGSTEGAMSFPGEHKMFYENDQKVTFHRITYGPSALHMAHHFKSGPRLVCFGRFFY